MNIVILDSNTMGTDLDLSVFEDLGNVTNYGFTKDEEVIERIKDAHVIIANKIEFNETNLPHAKNLRLICLTATGSNNIDKTYTKAHGITVSNVVGYSTDSVAQHTFAMLFYLYEKLAYYDQYVKSGSYCGDELFTHYSQRFNELSGKKWGIIGLGNIGRQVAKIASVFGAQVSYFSTSGRNNSADYPQKDLRELLKESDIISIHAPLNENTDQLIAYKELSMMKPSAFLINVGRGRIVNEDDLAKALNEDRIAGACLDVLEHEPVNSDNPLLKIQDSTKLLITPHIGWASIESRNRVVHEVYENIRSFKAGHPRNTV